MTAFDFEKHDSARSNVILREMQIRFLREKGPDYVRVWYLHQILDYISWW